MTPRAITDRRRPAIRRLLSTRLPSSSLQFLFDACTPDRVDGWVESVAKETGMIIPSVRSSLELDGRPTRPETLGMLHNRRAYVYARHQRG